jgi:2-C-methyl-D-erythritol 4-phosphate cytidylyltransferase
MRYWLVMPAAGASQRFGGARPKQHMALAGRTVLEVALQLFVDDGRCAGIALALDPDAYADAALRGRLDAKVQTVAGGALRCESVRLALHALEARAAADDWVLVHDAARACLSRRDLDRLLELGAGEAAGALLAVPVSDTLKQSDAAQLAERTVERSGLWQALTPQMFRCGPLRSALQHARAAGRTPTDEAQAMEWQGARAKLVAALDSNPKITNPEDLRLVAALCAARLPPH